MTTRLTVPTDHPYDVVIGNGVHEELRGLIGYGLGVLRVAIIHAPEMRDQAEQLRKPLPDWRASAARPPNLASRTRSRPP